MGRNNRSPVARSRVPRAMLEALDLAARRMDCTRSQCIRLIIAEHLTAHALWPPRVGGASGAA
jgi:hypothetical protein